MHADVEIVGEVERMLALERIRVPAPQLVNAPSDATAWTFEPSGSAIVVGADEGVPEGEHPLFDKLRARFHAAIGKPKLVRVDDERSYAEFRDLRRRPHLEELDARLARLERAFAEHISDHHGGFGDDVEAFDRYLDGAAAAPHDEYEQAVIGAVADAARGGQHIDLGLPRLHGKVECWRDGDEVIVSARLPGGIATTGAPLADHFSEVVGCAERVGCCGAEALAIGVFLAPIIAGRRLLGDLCSVADELDGPVIGVLVPRVDAGLAAAMALLQRCQQGDKAACREALRLAAADGSRLLREARKRLERAQKQKARHSIAPERWIR